MIAFQQMVMGGFNIQIQKDDSKLFSHTILKNELKMNET